MIKKLEKSSEKENDSKDIYNFNLNNNLLRFSQDELKAQLLKGNVNIGNLIILCNEAIYLYRNEEETQKKIKQMPESEELYVQAQRESLTEQLSQCNDSLKECVNKLKDQLNSWVLNNNNEELKQLYIKLNELVNNYQSLNCKNMIINILQKLQTMDAKSKESESTRNKKKGFLKQVQEKISREKPTVENIQNREKITVNKNENPEDKENIEVNENVQKKQNIQNQEINEEKNELENEKLKKISVDFVSDLVNNATNELRELNQYHDPTIKNNYIEQNENNAENQQQNIENPEPQIIDKKEIVQEQPIIDKNENPENNENLENKEINKEKEINENLNVEENQDNEENTKKKEKLELENQTVKILTDLCKDIKGNYKSGRSNGNKNWRAKKRENLKEKLNSLLELEKYKDNETLSTYREKLNSNGPIYEISTAILDELKEVQDMMPIKEAFEDEK